MFEWFVVPLDGSELAESALVVAQAMARRFDTGLVLVQADDEVETTRRFLEVRSRRLGLSATEAVVDSERRAPEAIIAAAAGRRDVAICMSTHGRGGIARALMGSVAEAVVRDSGLPSLLVGPSFTGHGRIGSGSVIVCTDGSEACQAAFPLAARWADAFGVSLWVVTVIDPEAEFSGQDVIESSFVSRAAGQIARRAGSVEFDVLHGRDPAEAIVRFAETKPDPLIVMTTHGRTGLRRAALGSVAMQVVRSATGPVLALRP